jgi:3-methyladenine DNA glycosylase AlkD
MFSKDDILQEIKNQANVDNKKQQQHFGIKDVNSYGLTQPQIKSIAKKIGTDHSLALKLWKTGIHEARHIATLIADKSQTNEYVMESWLKDLNSWDIVDGCCSNLFCKTPFAWQKAIEWSSREKEYEKRAGFSMMAYLAVHDKKASDKMFDPFFKIIKQASVDERNFVKKAVNWALRQIGKRNERLCKKAIAFAKEIHKQNDSSSRWIATDALRELEKYQKERKIKNVGTK